jgi:hypothetical protein
MVCATAVKWWQFLSRNDVKNQRYPNPILRPIAFPGLKRSS